MSIDKLLISKIENEVDFSEKDITSRSITIKNISLEQLKYYLLELGDIIEEDVDNSIFVVRIKSGFANANNCVMAIKYNKTKLLIKSFAKEGVIKQHTSEKAIDMIENKMGSNQSKIKTKKRKRGKVIISVVIVILILAIGFVSWQSYYVMKETKRYNQEINRYNNVVKKYNNTSKNVCVSNIDGFAEGIDKLPKEKETFFYAVASFLRGNNSKKIQSDIITLKNMKKDTVKKCAIMKRLENPTKEWIISRINNIDHIKDVKAVTNKKDSTGILKKKNGGCEECIYFINDKLEKNSADKSKDSIELGNDGGGAIEVYKKCKDAKDRCDYLKEFDDTILYTGSYAVVGTMVVRTSYRLTDEEQFELTNEIVKSFTK